MDTYTDGSTASIHAPSEDGFLVCPECPGCAEESTESADEFYHVYQASDDTCDRQLTPTSEIDDRVDGDTVVDVMTAYPELGVEEDKHAEGAPPVAAGGDGTGTYQIDGRGYGQHHDGKQEDDFPLVSHCTGTIERLLARDDVFDDDRVAHLCTVAQTIRSELEEAEKSRSRAKDDADEPVNSFARNDGARLTYSDQERSSANLYRNDERGDPGGQGSFSIRNDRGQRDDHDHRDDGDVSSDGVGMMNVIDTSSPESTPSPPAQHPRRVITEPVPTASSAVCPVDASTAGPARDTVSYPPPDHDPTVPSGQSARTCPTSRTPSPAEPPALPRVDVAGVGVRMSDARTECGEGARGGAGWGVFCANPVKRGEVVFEEEALLIVSRCNVEVAEWEIVLDAAEKVCVCVCAYACMCVCACARRFCRCGSLSGALGAGILLDDVCCCIRVYCLVTVLCFCWRVRCQ